MNMDKVHIKSLRQKYKAVGYSQGQIDKPKGTPPVSAPTAKPQPVTPPKLPVETTEAPSPSPVSKQPTPTAKPTTAKPVSAPSNPIVPVSNKAPSKAPVAIKPAIPYAPKNERNAQQVQVLQKTTQDITNLIAQGKNDNEILRILYNNPDLAKIQPDNNQLIDTIDRIRNGEAIPIHRVHRGVEAPIPPQVPSREEAAFQPTNGVPVEKPSNVDVKRSVEDMLNSKIPYDQVKQYMANELGLDVNSANDRAILNRMFNRAKQELVGKREQNVRTPQQEASSKILKWQSANHHLPKQEQTVVEQAYRTANKLGIIKPVVDLVNKGGKVLDIVRAIQNMPSVKGKYPHNSIVRMVEAIRSIELAQQGKTTAPGRGHRVGHG